MVNVENAMDRGWSLAWSAQEVHHHLQRAMDLVRHLITRYGMREALKLETLKPPRQALFFQVPTGAPRAYSNETVRIINADNGRGARGTPLWGAEEKSMPSFDTVKQYLLDVHLSIVREDPASSLVVVEDEDRGVKNLVVDCEEPLLVFEQIIMPVPSNPGEMFRRLLQMNRCIVQGAFGLDEAGTRVLYRHTLPLAHLGPNEVEGTIEALRLALAEFGSELIGFTKQ